MESKIRNAKIEGTQLGYGDHGVMTCWLYLGYGGSGQAFGGYRLDVYNKKTGKEEGTAYGLSFIKGILDVLEVESWEELVGTHCRTDATSRKVLGIGHIVKDKWFYPERDLAIYLGEK